MMKYFITAVILYGLYFLMCYMGTGTERKNMGSTNYYSYSDSLQEKIKHDKRLKEMIPPEKKTGITFLSNLLLFTIVFALIALLLGINDFLPSFLYLLILGEGLNVFDFLVIDLCWWRHTKRIRLKGIGTDADYQNIDKHLASFLRALPMFAIAAALAALIITIL